MKLTFLAVVMILAIGCKGGGGGGASNAKDPAPNNVPDVDTEVVVTSNKIPDEYVGLWIACVNNAPENTSVLKIYNLSSNSLIMTEVNYLSIDCNSSTMYYEDRYVYDVTRNGTDYDARLAGASSLPYQSSRVSFYNNYSYCGYTDWTINVPRNMLDKTCSFITYETGKDLDVSFSKSEDNLVVTINNKYIIASPYHVPVFGHNGTAPSNGTYVYYHNKVAHTLIINSGTFTLDMVNAETKEFHTQAGTYTFSGDEVTYTVTSETPSCSNVGSSFSLKYSPAALAIVMKNEDNEMFTAETFNWSVDEFADAFVGTATTTGCN